MTEYAIFVDFSDASALLQAEKVFDIYSQEREKVDAYKSVYYN